MSHDGEDENQEDPGYKTYLEPLRVPPAPAEPQPPPTEPASEPPSDEGEGEGEGEGEDQEAPVYKTYVQPLRVPATRAEPPPTPPEPRSEPVAEPIPPPRPAPPEPGSRPDRAPQSPPPPIPPLPARADFENFEFRKPGQASRRRRVFGRTGAAVAVAVMLALAYPLVNPFGSSSRSSLTQYLQRFQPIALRADQDRRSVQAAVNAVRRNPKSRTAAARRLVSANKDRQTLIRRLAGLGPAPGPARALPGRLARLLRSQVETARVWQRWMLHRPFVYLKHDRGTRNRIQALLASQQASKGSFTRLYAQLMRGAGLANPGGA